MRDDGCNQASLFSCDCREAIAAMLDHSINYQSNSLANLENKRLEAVGLLAQVEFQVPPSRLKGVLPGDFH